MSEVDYKEFSNLSQRVVRLEERIDNLEDTVRGLRAVKERIDMLLGKLDEKSTMYDKMCEEMNELVKNVIRLEHIVESVLEDVKHFRTYARSLVLKLTAIGIGGGLLVALSHKLFPF